MKSYTDLEQSKKLAEMLPLESADMTYRPIMDIDSMSNSGFWNIPECYPFNEFKDCYIKPLPCWSIAALLNVLPHGARLLRSATDDTYHCDCPKGNIDKWFDNPIDACYQMIIKLHEQKIL